MQKAFHMPVAYGRLSLVAVAGLFVRRRQTHVPEYGVLYQRKPELALLATFFFIAALMKASLQRAPIKKPESFDSGFSLVDYTIEISNLDLITDISDIVDYWRFRCL